MDKDLFIERYDKKRLRPNSKKYSRIRFEHSLGTLGVAKPVMAAIVSGKENKIIPVTAYCINEHSNHTKRLKKCSEKLIGISQLENNWNENGAEKFSYKLIVKCYSILVGLPFLPEIFPVADGSIQFEYEKKDGSYLEFNIFEDEISEFLSYPNEKEIEKNVSIDKISEEVKNFYERSSK